MQKDNKGQKPDEKAPPAAAPKGGSAPADPSIAKKVKEESSKVSKGVGGEKEKVREKVFEQQASNIKVDQVIKQCTTLTTAISTILNADGEENNEEFVETIRAVENILDQILKNQGMPLSKMDLVRLQYYLEDFHGKIVKMQTNGRLMKFLTSNRLRKKLEESNLNIMYIMKRIEQSSTPSADGKKLTSAPSQIFFYDEQGKIMWESQFGIENNLVEWNKFIKGLSSYTKQKLELSQELCLKRVLDDRYVGVVSPFKFSQFLRGFGPLKDCVAKTVKLLNQKWFHGFLSRREATLLLTDQKPGTFLIRFSKSQPGSFAVAFVSEKGHVISSIIESEMPKGVKIKQQGGSEQRFKDLDDLLVHYAEHLVYPYDQALPEEAWFQGDLTQEEAELLLQGKPVGTFLIRMGDSLDKQAFWATYVDMHSKAVHLAIDRTDKGFRIEGSNKEWVSVREWLLASRSFLKYNYDKAGVPLFRVADLKPEHKHSLAGPKEADKADDIRNPNSDPSAQTVGLSSSTYPTAPGMWSLICDRYRAEIYANWRVVALADGCNWGPRPKTAAWKASQAFMEFITSQSKQFVTTQEIGYLMLKGFSQAHEAVIQDHKEDIWDAGTTTLIGGVLVPLNEGKGQHDPKWGFVCASVGDCKAFVYSPTEKTAVDVTLGNRGGLDATDPGGRLGPFVGRAGEPDMRNLHLYFATCNEGDIIILMSDGVHDNLDAYSLGLTPADAGIPGVKEWKDIPNKDSVVGFAKSVFMCKKLEEVIRDVVPHDARHISTRLLQHSMGITESSRVFMAENPNKKLPIDYVTYPGKMDHATVVAMTV